MTNKTELFYLTIHEAHELLKNREISSEELTKAVLDRSRRVDDRVKGFVTTTEEFALEQARSADKRLRNGEANPLLGIPVGIKDNMCTRGIRTTCSSRMLEKFIPPYNATVVEKLWETGAVMVGKTNMDEFAMGSSTENSAFYTTHNPWDLERVPGGSSGGSAAVVASGEALYALGSDTGGSIRQPAGFCNIVGLKPTYGRVSRFGLVAFASSLDQIGPMCRDVTDCALVMNVIAGHDHRDSTSIHETAPDYTKALKTDLKGIRLGVPKEFFVQGMESGVKDVMEAAIRQLETLGATVDRDVSLTYIPYSLAVYYILAPSEAMANLARYDGVKYGYSADAPTMWESLQKTRQLGFGAEVKRRIMLGTYALSAGYYDAYYLKAQKVRTLIREEFRQAFEKYDALIAPTSPSVPFKIGEKAADPVQMYLSDVCTIPVNIAGIPGLTVPAGFSEGLPVGMQVIGKPLSEEMLLRIGFAYEQATGWQKKRPSL
ncbi:MAG: Asp-tRNA(Asn)/Glu-tRNA(Gln) amidotransferase subunit GatA [Dehalococcoidia bacterium]|nr:Asp-tRNA(Asn)/Glu-tRNA(Gln) amidotransferase subunit GatA [Dehalococcoidia bacterium]